MGKRYKKITVKIGSNVLTRKDGTLNVPRIAHLVDQVAALHKAGLEIVLVSSGAVASGRAVLTPAKKYDAVSSRQLWSALGQVKLISRYSDLLREHGLVCAQVLLTKENFAGRGHYLNMKNCLNTLLENRVIPIVNENDTISVTELMFTDNDELSGLIATMAGSEALIILTNVDGVYTGAPGEPGSELVAEIGGEPGGGKRIRVSRQMSGFGRGGMVTKLRIARKVAAGGIAVHIANGNRENILLDLLDPAGKAPGTYVVPDPRPVSGVKNWIAYSESFAAARVTVNEGAARALTSSAKAVSLLPVGVASWEGSFRARGGSRRRSDRMSIIEQLERTRRASRGLGLVPVESINNVLNGLAAVIEENTGTMLAANRRDLERMDPADPKYDRLRLTEDGLRGIAAGMRSVAGLPDPVGRVLGSTVRPNGLRITRVAVPFGVIGIIYEARPNVTFDVFSLCLKSGNACVLKGGSDAIDSNTAAVSLIRGVLERAGIDRDVVALLPAGREETAEMMNARDLIDLIIPRGGRGLIDFVRENSSVPVIETGAGICHTYFDASGDRDKGRDIVHNAKTRRPAVCNALDCLIIHRSRLADLPHIAGLLGESGVTIYADGPAREALAGRYPEGLLLPADEGSFGTEFLSLRMAVKTVGNLDEALDHIARFGSKHSEAIVSEDDASIARFLKLVDASSVYANASTAFTDGGQFGLGAEIGISTQKLHARGPMGLEELTTYKWIVEGDGQVRPK